MCVVFKIDEGLRKEKIPKIFTALFQNTPKIHRTTYYLTKLKLTNFSFDSFWNNLAFLF